MNVGDSVGAIYKYSKDNKEWWESYGEKKLQQELNQAYKEQKRGCYGKR